MRNNMSRFAKIALILFSIAVVVVVGIIGLRFHAAGPSNFFNANTPSTTQAITCNDWNLINSPSPGNAKNALTAVAAVSSHDVWAAGMAKNSAGQQALFEHWN